MLERVKDSLLKNKKVSIVTDFNDVLNNMGSDVFLMQNDFLQLRLPKNYFDKIISMEVLRYIDDVPKSLENVKSIMKENSIFVFTITNLFSFSFFPIKYSIRKFFNIINKKDELLQYFVTEGQIKREIKNAGLKIISFKKLNLLSFNPIIESIVDTDTKARKIMHWDNLLSKIPIINHLFDTFIIAVKLDTQNPSQNKLIRI
jgi:2-polyprenyl-3-methyl-5-hydroxy-6-metoxy-1,4-benzoquinol methylase